MPIASRTAPPNLAPADVAHCEGWIKQHSRSFYLASRLLPGPVRDAAWVLYAFCRRSDDAVDGGGETDALLRRLDQLRARLDVAHGQRESSADPIDRAYAEVARGYGIPRALPEALLAGMEMDARGARYETMEDLYVYAFRVASSVGLMMTCVMGPSRPDALLRAAELGLGMQLTNIARDVGEDARRGRVYLPASLLSAAGESEASVRAAGPASLALRLAVRRLLEDADRFYVSSERGVPLLPRACRPAVLASRRIYAAIGDDLRRHGYDPVSRRAHTGTAEKLLLAARGLASVMASPAPPARGPEDALLTRLIAGCGLDARG